MVKSVTTIWLGLFAMLNSHAGIEFEKPAGRPSELALVVRVLDGDTLAVLYDENQVRTVDIRGIDAPENNQAYGEVATGALKVRALNTWVIMKCYEQNAYGRDFCEIKHQDTKMDIGMSMVAGGHAWAHYQFANSSLIVAAEDASRSKIGLFQYGSIGIMTPWEFRQKELEVIALEDELESKRLQLVTNTK